MSAITFIRKYGRVLVLLSISILLMSISGGNKAAAQFTDSTRDVNWSPEGLSFENFRIVQPSRKKQPLSVGAVTFSQPGVEVSVSELARQRVIKISMTNRFSYNKSWISEDALQDSGLLSHEQGHFDINEIYTRKTFQQLKRVRFSNNFQGQIARVMEIMNQELKKVQQAYERQTMHGLLTDQQAQWNKMISASLSALPPYQGQCITQALPQVATRADSLQLRYQ